MPSGPDKEASCCMIVLAKSSVLQVDFDVAVQASLAALAALASAAGSRGTSTSSTGLCFPDFADIDLCQLLPCYHQLRPTFL